MYRALALILGMVVLISVLAGCSVAGGADLDKVSGLVVDANTRFGFDIFKELNKEDADSSVFMSPFSISTALTMTYNGAASTTLDGMGRALGFDALDRSVVNESYKELLRHLEKVDSKTTLNIANSIWIRDGYPIKQGFLDLNKDTFDVLVRELDFSKSDAPDTINSWIKDKTSGMIEKMIDSIDTDTVMYLINAVYFKGQWKYRFDPKDTFSATFQALNGQTQTVDMMSRKGTLEYTKGDNYQAVRLPYGSNKLSMYLILPDEGININDFIDALDADKWQKIRTSMTEVEDAMLQIPKFRLEYGIKNLNAGLAALGMEEAFGPGADFSDIHPGLFIARVLHKAVIEVNEEGSKAAGVTVVEMKESAAADQVSFIANRPFVFVITDDTTGTILFMGKLSEISS
ncbi:MAG TPA: serpin family protein [Candidatus Atribacteria bacterium]|nr:serpin family protein [Candidatus Atribacteria bacterium]